jgi:imidazolonepropionase-like amidohydrolase
MRSTRLCPSLAVVCLFAVACQQAEEPQSQTAQAPATVFVGATIIDGTGSDPTEDGVLVVRNGRVDEVGSSDTVSVPVGSEQVDLSGRTIMPGMINSHGHAAEETATKLGLYARYGVTTVVSLGDETAEHVAIRDSQDSPGLRQARLYVAGPVMEGAISLEQAADTVALAAGMNVDWVKIRVDDDLGAEQKMTEEVYTAVIEDAHSRNLRVAAHVFYQDDARQLLRSGVDLLAHSVRDRDVDDELISLMIENDICLVPTLTREVSTFAYATTPEWFDDPFFLKGADPAGIEEANNPENQQAMSTSPIARAYRDGLVVAQRNMKALSDAGIRIAMGTDSGANPLRFPGYFEHMELDLMADAGLTPMQIIVAATGDAARCMGLSETLGTLTPGKWADFSVMSANPLDDISNTKTMESVWIAGNRVPDAN